MSDPRTGDPETGLELQIDELIVRRERARRQGWMDQVDELEREITALYLELAETTAEAAHQSFRPVVIKGVEKAGDRFEPPRSA
jgi:hypothetical protein